MFRLKTASWLWSCVPLFPLAVPLAVIGGGGNSGGGGNGGGGTQMQAGQWEFVVTPNDGSAVFYVEANLTPSGETVFAAVANTGIYQQQTFTGEGIGAGFCSNQTLNGNISGDTLTGNTNDGGRKRGR